MQLEQNTSRTDLLPADDAAKVRALLMKYIDQRILYYNTLDDEQLRSINAQTAKLQVELWSTVRSPFLERSNRRRR